MASNNNQNVNQFGSQFVAKREKKLINATKDAQAPMEHKQELLHVLTKKVELEKQRRSSTLQRQFLQLVQGC
jgi:hypothetical protein